VKDKSLHDRLTPPQVVRELDRFIIGQDRAKKAVAIALRNRWRRREAAEEIRDEILPNNILMIGPTGVGKTEIARRLARLTHAPFVKVEASKFTEVGYVGRDVESMVRDLVELSINQVLQEMREGALPRAEERAEERIAAMLTPTVRTEAPDEPSEVIAVDSTGVAEKVIPPARDTIRDDLRAGKLDRRWVNIDVDEKSGVFFDIFAASGMNSMDPNLGGALEKMMPNKSKRKRMRVEDARRILVDQEIEGLVDKESATEEGKRRAEQAGIIFLDEIDKIAGGGRNHGPDVSREGVQRDLLPVVEGSQVPTKHGLVSTEHILFIAAGAFHQAKPSDLIPELQGRFPIRVELDSLTAAEFVRILNEPENSLVRQYRALLEAEGVELEFEPEAIEEIASLAESVNERTENIGARRLHTLLSTLLEEILFEVPDRPEKSFRIDREFVIQRLGSIADDVDLSRYIL